MKKTKWLIYTVVIGLIPFIIRTFITLFDKTATFSYWLNEADFIVFGLVLNLTNINELEDRDFEDKRWKSKNIGTSVFFIIIFAAIFAIVTYTDFKASPDINTTMVKSCSIVLAIVSFIISYSIYDRLTNLEK
ncbi:MAG: hypothetical protein CVV22_03470 [Ignavibacteriae bacterium HGW-Ignavibacteriae-1]|jgi:hypothetical protein|nr:MAG: hypothetical protein CVV22_03470 [Ignavibacteriae bacterium HGW-Ignavibacteriae-1]